MFLINYFINGGKTVDTLCDFFYSNFYIIYKSVILTYPLLLFKTDYLLFYKISLC